MLHFWSAAQKAAGYLQNLDSKIANGTKGVVSLSVTTVATVEMGVVFGLGMLMIQVGEFAIASALWLCLFIALFLRGVAQSTLLRKAVWIIGAFLITIVLIVWTPLRKGDQPWSAFSPPVRYWYSIQSYNPPPPEQRMQTPPPFWSDLPLLRPKELKTPALSLLVFPSVDKGGLLMAFENTSDALAREPYYMPVMWDLDGDNYKEPLKVPARSFKDDWILPKGNFGPYPLTKSDNENRVAPGHRVFGYVVISCPLCGRQKVYWVWNKIGTREGWYSKVGPAPSFRKIEEQLPLIRQNFDAFLDTYRGKRIPIKDYP